MSATRWNANWVGRFAPIVSWLPGYHLSWLGRDAVAGIAVAAVAIPTAMGYSSVAMVPVQVGLYALPAALVLYAVFGSSRQVAIGPTSTVALMSGAVVAGLPGHEDPGRAIALSSGVALVAGLWLALFGILRLGWVTDFISRPVIVGFSFGLGLVVIAGELPHMLGVPSPSGHFAQRVWTTLGELGQTSPLTVALAVGGLALLFLGDARRPTIPWALLLMGIGVVLARTWNPADHGIEMIGSVPRGLPTFEVPALGLSDIEPLLLGGLAVAVAAVGEGLSAARIFANKGNYRVNSDSEFLGTGVANIGAGLTGGMGVCGSLSRTGTAATSGARTQVSSLITALAVVLFLLTMTGLLNGVPRVFLSCIVVFSVFFLLDIATLRYYRRVRRNDFTSALAGLGGVLILGPLYGLLLAVGLSLLGLTFRASRVHIDPLGKIPGEKAGWAALQGHPERMPTPAFSCFGWTHRCSGPTAPPPTPGSSNSSTTTQTPRHWCSIWKRPDRWTPPPSLNSRRYSSNSGQRASNCSSRACTTPRGSSCSEPVSPTTSAGATSGTASPRRCGPPRDMSEGSLCRKARTLPNWTGWPIQADVPGVSAPRQTLPQNGSSGVQESPTGCSCQYRTQQGLPDAGNRHDGGVIRRLIPDRDRAEFSQRRDMRAAARDPVLPSGTWQHQYRMSVR